jgi:hypothetical protein
MHRQAYLFIERHFLSNLDYIPSNENMIGEWWIGKDIEAAVA